MCIAYHRCGKILSTEDYICDIIGLWHQTDNVIVLPTARHTGIYYTQYEYQLTYALCFHNICPHITSNQIYKCSSIIYKSDITFPVINKILDRKLFRGKFELTRAFFLLAISLISNGIKAWMDTYINVKQWNAIVVTCPNLIDSLVKRPLKLWHGWVITFYIKLRI